MLISVIVPAYNAEKYIDNCIESIYKDAPNNSAFEVIVINDGSLDKTAEKISNLRIKYGNITQIDLENSGVSVARNIGINRAKGKYVLFLDADDELIDGSFSKLCSFLSNYEQIDMLVTRQVRRRDGADRIVPAPPLAEGIRYTGVEAFALGFVRTNAGGGICLTSFLRNNYIFVRRG